LEADIQIDESEYILFFQVENHFAEFLCNERSDAFLVALIFHAMSHGHDVKFEGPISSRLFYQLDSTLIDFLISIYPEKKMRRITIDAPIVHEVLPSVGASGTGISCGIDSLAAVARQNSQKYGDMGITHLCFFNIGSHGETGSNEEQKLFEERRARSIAFCLDADYPFVEVISNLHEIVDPNFGLTHTYRNVSAVLALQKLFSNYYYASTYTAQSFLEHTYDPAYFEILLLAMLSTENTCFYSSETTLGRYEKTRMVAEYPMSRKYLNVCNVQNINCGRCNKCLRTLLTLDSLGKLDDFTEVFDIMAYREQRDNHLAYHCRRYLAGEHNHRELHPHLKNQLGIVVRATGLLHYLIGRCKIQLRRMTSFDRVIRRMRHGS
jgi:hypothetical protein